MRIGLITTFFYIFIFFSYGQTSKNSHGFGELKLGMTLEGMEKAVDCELLKENNEPFFPFKQIDGRLLTYKLSRYEINQEHTIEDIELVFFDERLYKITIGKYNSQSEFDLTSKYGKPTIEHKEIEKYGELFSYVSKSWTVSSDEQFITCYASSNKHLQLDFVSYSLEMEDLEIGIEVSNLRRANFVRNTKSE